jgi:hydroxypyruvate reductase
MAEPPRQLLRQLFDAAIRRALPAVCLPPLLPARPRGRLVVVGAGKAAASMAAAVEANWDGPLDGLVVTRYGHAVPCRHVEVVEAAHPVPDEAGMAAAGRILERVRGLGPDDLVLALISGGASALLALPAPGVTLAEKQSINRALLRSGATIAEMNCVRKHLSAIKGGRLAEAAFPAPVVTLVISDVPGDDPSVIGSGPTVADPTTHRDALAILRKYAIDISPAVTARLSGSADETPKPDAACFVRADLRMIVTPQAALEAAAEIARANGYTPTLLGDSLEGEARMLASSQAALARQVAGAGPTVLLSGGETTVTIRGKGRGGRNAEYLLALALALDGAPGIYAIAGDTDGIDGTEDNAGAIVTPDTLARAAALGIDGAAHLAENDAYGFFETLGDLVVTGPSLTNVNDFRAILVDAIGG